MDFYGILFDMKNGKKIPYSKNYFDTLFAAKLEELGVKTLTGTLPLNFRTSETALRSWTIYGNNTQHNYSAEGTLPLTFTTHTAGNADDWSISGNDENGTENLCELTIANCGIDGNGSLTSSTAWQMICAPIVSGEKYTIVSDNIVYGLYASKPEVGSTAYNSTRYAPGGTARTFTADITGWVAIRLASNKSNIVMLVEGSTAPDHYIPYQQGVGERTANILDAQATDSDKGYVSAAFLKTDNTIQSNNSFMVSEYFPIEPSTTYTLSSIVNHGTSTAICFYDANKVFISGERLYAGGIEITNVTTPGNAAFYRTTVQISQQIYSSAMIIKGSTAPNHFIPYGYQIPLTVSQTGQPDKIVDIYIGDSKLGEAEYVDYGEQKIYKSILFMTHNDKQFITKDNKDFCLRRRGYNG